MPPKQKTPAPIDRPLSRAYLREFSGWSTAYPPGVSEPSSLRIMENVLINRDGSARVRPGLRHLSRADDDTAFDLEILGTHEAFFLDDGSPAYLVAVRETNGTVGFRVMTRDGELLRVRSLDDPVVGFTTTGTIGFTAGTTYVKYLQIDNKIFALSNNGEPAILFYVGQSKEAKQLQAISRPNWSLNDKLRVVQPAPGWVVGAVTKVRQNRIENPSFELGMDGWSLDPAAPGDLQINSTEAWVGSNSLQITNTAGTTEDIILQYDPIPIDPLLVKQYIFNVQHQTAASGHTAHAGIRWLNANMDWLSTSMWTQTSVTPDWSTYRAEFVNPTGAAYAQPLFKLVNAPAASEHLVDGAIFEEYSAFVVDYFDGDSTDTSGQGTTYEWVGTPHASPSTATTPPMVVSIPGQLQPTSETLVGSGDNPYNYGFFYTLSNEVGESSASQITLVKAQRGATAWSWNAPDAFGAPKGNEVENPELAADQLVAYMPQPVFNSGVAQGALRWSLYMFSWSDQEPVPVEAWLVATRELPPGATYNSHGWARVHPASVIQAEESAPLPAPGNLYNYSDPTRAAQGIVAADRMVLVHDPAAGGTIKWTSSQPGQYLDFSPSKGGGRKVLSSGNLYVPAAVKLWQNPESKDTLTVLCMGVDGYSTSYYMAPAQVATQSSAMNVMAFEETTATPGTVSPFGCEVLNNALYHPLETELMKSTASNYNINHKSMTDLIANMWGGLRSKEKIVSSQLDNRLYYIVHNRYGAELEDGCWGNEVWVLDIVPDGGVWSRWLVQAQSLRKIEFDGKIVMSVVRPDGVYIFDEAASVDEYVAADRTIAQRPIPWRLETNTQGANRAHDAWAHLQQVSITLGDFSGKVRWGVRGHDLHGMVVEASKVTEVVPGAGAPSLSWDREDHLLVRRDMKEWHFFAESLPEEPSAGQVSLVQYRYTPVSVNVGYEYGTVESFEYARNLTSGANAVSVNGIPQPYVVTRDG